MKVVITSISTKKSPTFRKIRNFESFHVEEVINALTVAKINDHGGN